MARFGDSKLRKGGSRWGQVSFGSHRGHLGGAWSPERGKLGLQVCGAEGGAVLIRREWTGLWGRPRGSGHVSLGPRLWLCPGETHILLFFAGLSCAGHGDVRLQGSRGLGLDRDGAGLLPPNRAFVWGSGWGLPSPLSHPHLRATLPLCC